MANPAIKLAVVDGSNLVAGSFTDLNLTESYYYIASAVRSDLITPIGRLVSEILPTMTLNTNSYGTVQPSVMPAISENPVVLSSTAILLPALKSTSTVIVPAQSMSAGTVCDQSCKSIYVYIVLQFCAITCNSYYYYA